MKKILYKLSNKSITIFGCIFVLCSIFLFQTLYNKANDKEDEKTQEVILQLPDDFIDNVTVDPETENDLFIFKSQGNGTCVLTEIKEKYITEIKIPEKSSTGDIVTKIGSNAFRDCKMLASITIPATVKEISADAFIDCENLVTIMTSSSNTKFCSVGGVLHSKDKTVLICYPANRVGNSYLLSTNIKRIEENAFYDLKNLGKLLYEGSISEFGKIEIAIGNQLFQKLPTTCNYTSSKA